MEATNLPNDGRKALAERYKGRFTIEKMIGPNAARLSLPPSMLIHPVFHVSLLRPVVEEPEHLWRTPEI